MNITLVRLRLYALRLPMDELSPHARAAFTCNRSDMGYVPVGGQRFWPFPRVCVRVAVAALGRQAQVDGLSRHDPLSAGTASFG